MSPMFSFHAKETLFFKSQQVARTDKTFLPLKQAFLSFISLGFRYFPEESVFNFLVKASGNHLWKYMFLGMP